MRRGRTPALTEDQARRLLASIKVVRKVALGDGAEAEEHWLVGLRDRALMAVMTYTFRVSAVVAMRVEDYLPGRQALVVRLHEKGGKRHEMPAHHKLEQFLDEYLAVAGIRENGKTPLFRSALAETGVLTDKPMNRVDAYRMVRRRTADAGFRVKLGCHVFRATGISAYIEAGGTLENAQAMAGHESSRQPSFTTAPATRSRSLRSSGSGFSGSPALSVFRCMSRREKRNHFFKPGVGVRYRGHDR